VVQTTSRGENCVGFSRLVGPSLKSSCVCLLLPFGFLTSLHKTHFIDIIPFNYVSQILQNSPLLVSGIAICDAAPYLSWSRACGDCTQTCHSYFLHANNRLFCRPRSPFFGFMVVPIFKDLHGYRWVLNIFSAPKKHPQKTGANSEPSPEKFIISVTLEKNISKMVVQQANNQPPGFATLQKIPVIFEKLPPERKWISRQNLSKTKVIWHVQSSEIANEISADLGFPTRHLWWHLVGGAIIILKNMKVNGKDDIPLYEMENNIHVWNHQSDYIITIIFHEYSMNYSPIIPTMLLLLMLKSPMKIPWISYLWILWNLAFTSMIFANCLPYYIPLRELQTPNQIHSSNIPWSSPLYPI